MTTLKSLLTELLIEILSRLPPESLSSFKSVCKFWYALINDPTNCSLQHKCILIRHRVKVDLRKYTFKLSLLKFSQALDRPISIHNVNLPFNEDISCLNICGHSHGLVCLSFRRDIFLCNLMTKEFRKLPPSILKFPYRPEFPIITCIGFEYDSKSRDFKVVRIVDFLEFRGGVYPTQVEIYELSKDRWREVKSKGHALLPSSMMMHHAGTYYRLAEKENGSEVIQTFDMSEEVLGEIPVPDSITKNQMNERSIDILNESIVIFDYPTWENEKTFDIWEMEKDEYGIFSWSKLLTIGPLFGIVAPLMFVSSDELLMEANEEQMMFYNIKTHRSKGVPIKGCPHGFQTTFFVKSLVPVRGGNNIIYEF